MSTWTIYKHTNKINGKSYVGQTSLPVEQRWQDGHGYDNQEFGKAIKEFGWDGFTHEILAENITDKALADRLEIYYIKKYNCRMYNIMTVGKWGYNVRAGGHWRSRLSILTDEDKEKLVQYYTHPHKKVGWLKAFKEMFPDKTNLSLDPEDPDEIYREIYSIAKCANLVSSYATRLSCYGQDIDLWESDIHVANIEKFQDGTTKVEEYEISAEEARNEYREKLMMKKIE